MVHLGSLSFQLGLNQKRGLESQQRWNLIPQDTDILITHGPPHSIGDLCRLVFMQDAKTFSDGSAKHPTETSCFGHYEGYGSIQMERLST